ncbi:recombinase family protein [Streptomyces sp. P1-3]|uniref:recombinase family protein n=1 Tax=Streptomyces sp. P1-3 TaxID=3421658 RepID=UPI003D361F82
MCPPAARLWSSTMINKMLRNPRYAGMVSYSGKHRVDASKEWDGWSLVLFDDDGPPPAGLLGSHRQPEGLVAGPEGPGRRPVREEER